MSPRKPNMLEAFQASARAEQAEREAASKAAAASEAAAPGAPAAPAAPTDEVGGVGGPFAGAHAPAPAPAAPRPVRDVVREGDLVLGTAPRGGARSASRLPWIALALLLAMAAMFFVGRDFGRETEAGPETPPAAERGADPAEVVPDPPADPPRSAPRDAASESQLTADDRAFLSRENRFTVRAIQFENDARGAGLALEAYRYLRSVGLPAVAPITQGEVLVICVGAQPSRNEELQRVRAELHKLPGPPPRSQRGAFESAYFVNIEDQIDDSLRR